MKRRSFLKTSALLSTPLVLGGVPVAPIHENVFSGFLNQDTDRVLVLIQLNGGNDGLNCVIPRDQYSNLTVVRPQVIIPENDILDVTDTVGFHPSMSALQNMYSEGKMNIIQGVGYPNQNRSHFRSTDIWHTASDADTFLNTGWLGRYLDHFHEGFPANFPNEECPDPFALTIGSSVSETCQGTAGNFSLALVDPDNLSQLSSPINNDLSVGCYADKLDFLAKTIEQTNAYGEVIQEANDMGMNASTLYNENDGLANKLKLVAKLIKGGLRTKIYVVSLGGFDTHADQVVDGETTTGVHAALLQELSDAIYAFQDDLKAMDLEERVVGMTYSEFGRRIRSNFSNGTDHGTAAPLIVFGNCVMPGIIGDNPEISVDVDNQEGVPMQYDFRSVYGSILSDWFDVDEAIVNEILLGDFQKINLLQNCSSPVSTEDQSLQNIELNIYPNPASNRINIEFESKGEDIKISLFDALGQEIQVLTNRRFSSGLHSMIFESHELSAGVYFIRIQTKIGQKTKRIVKA
ncbi:MAG: DUF1501 domain-containing protein [Saprospiraceae bacterium]|nr:DUF1501 domain-containing protein [Saprospiraceae bacterium]